MTTHMTGNISLPALTVAASIVTEAVAALTQPGHEVPDDVAPDAAQHEKIKAGEAAVEHFTELVAMSDVRIDGGTQARVKIDYTIVKEYAEALQERVNLPPVVLYYDEDADAYWLADGFHRFHAHHLIGRVAIWAVVKDGTQRDAKLHAAGANGTHGLPRTNADKRCAVLMLLGDPEWMQWSDREIAKACSVSHPLVAEVRRGLTGNSSSEHPAARTYTTKHGMVTTMNTAKIGNKKKAVAEARDDKAVQEAPREDSAPCAEKSMADGAADNPVPDHMCASKPREAIPSHDPRPNESNDELAEAKREIERLRAHVAAQQEKHDARLQVEIDSRADLERRLDEAQSRETQRDEQLHVLGDLFAELRELLGATSARAVLARVKQLVAASSGSTDSVARQSKAQQDRP